MKTYGEKEVDGVLNYMTIFHPEKADREYCRALLEYWEMALKHIAINNPDDIEKIYKAFEASKQNNGA
jgi:hypothetical protein